MTLAFAPRSPLRHAAPYLATAALASTLLACGSDLEGRWENTDPLIDDIMRLDDDGGGSQDVQFAIPNVTCADEDASATGEAVLDYIRSVTYDERGENRWHLSYRCTTATYNGPNDCSSGSCLEACFEITCAAVSAYLGVSLDSELDCDQNDAGDRLTCQTAGGTEVVYTLAGG